MRKIVYIACVVISACAGVYFLLWGGLIGVVGVWVDGPVENIPIRVMGCLVFVLGLACILPFGALRKSVKRWVTAQVLILLIAIAGPAIAILSELIAKRHVSASACEWGILCSLSMAVLVLLPLWARVPPGAFGNPHDDADPDE